MIQLSRSCSWCVLATGLALAGACGGPSSGDPDAEILPPDGRIPQPADAAADADLRDAMQPPTDDAGVLAFGPGTVFDELRLAESGHAWAGWAPFVNPLFQQSITSGEMILLLELRGLDDPSGQNDPNVDIAIFLGQDADGDPSNNFSGSGEFLVADESLDPIGNPRALLPGGSILNGRLNGAVEGEIILFLPTIGQVRVQDPVFSGDLIASDDGQRVAEIRNGRLRGTLLAQHLEAVSNPVPEFCVAGSMLDLVTLPCLGFTGVGPDVDVDQDGLEQFDEVTGQVDGRIDECTDGDGTVYVSIPLVQCVLDPAFADGFTVEIEMGAVSAVLLPPAG